MWPDLPLYAAHRSASGQWLVRAPCSDPLLPAAPVVAVLSEHVDRPSLPVRLPAISRGGGRLQKRWPDC
jgi:hypothetical protein